jgi:trk system potassium uptake protein TrkA
MKIIIVGCGRVGVALAQSMSNAGHEVAVVDVKPSAFDRLGTSFKGRLVQGICFDRDVLLRAGIETADAFAAVTSSDNANALAARVARDRFNVARVVARIFDPQRRALYERLGLRTVSTATWGAVQIERLLTSPEMESLHSICDGEVQIVQVMVEDALNGRPASLLARPDESTLIAITRASRTFLPASDVQLQIGDIVMLAVRTEALKHISAIVKMRQEA